MSNTLGDDLEDIISFVKGAKIFFDEESCEIKRSKLGGLGVFAKTDLAEDTVLLRVPKTSVFSAKNSIIYNLLDESGVDGMTALNIAFIYEVFVFGTSSHWYKYLNSIKHKQDDQLYLPPAYWDDSLKVLLKNTALDLVYEGLSPQDEIESGFKLGIALARKWHQDVSLKIPYMFDFNLEDQQQVQSNFKEYAAVAFAISSRVFEIDSHHEFGLVVIADLFNHNAESADVRFESLYDVEETGESDSEDVEEIVVKDTSSRDESQTGLDSLNPDECVDIVLANDVTKDSEIFNSYGDHSNSYLLARYGFCVQDNVHDVVDLSEEVLEYGKTNSKRLGDRLEWWEEELHAIFKEWYQASRQPEADSGSDSEPESEAEEPQLPDETDAWGFVYLEHPGTPNEILTALLNLLTMPEPKYKSLAATRTDALKLAARLPLLESKLSRDAKSLLRSLCQAKKYPKIPAPALSNHSMAQIHLLVSSEASILQTAIGTRNNST